jgi:hypothetical protein
MQMNHAIVKEEMIEGRSSTGPTSDFFLKKNRQFDDNFQVEDKNIKYTIVLSNSTVA